MFRALFRSSKEDPFNQAAAQFRKLRHLIDDQEEYASTLLEIIRLCQLAIRKKKSDGDVHVLLANAYYLVALRTLRVGYQYCLPRAAAVIYEWKTHRLPTRNRAIGERVYQGVLESLERPTTDWMNVLPKGDMSDMHREYYHKAISPDTVVELSKLLTSA